MSDASDYLSARFDTQVERVASALEYAAQRVRQSGKVHPGTGHVGAALGVMSEVRGMNANLPLESLVQAAHDAQSIGDPS